MFLCLYLSLIPATFDSHTLLPEHTRHIQHNLFWFKRVVRDHNSVLTFLRLHRMKRGDSFTKGETVDTPNLLNAS